MCSDDGSDRGIATSQANGALQDHNDSEDIIMFQIAGVQFKRDIFQMGQTATFKTHILKNWRWMGTSHLEAVLRHVDSMDFREPVVSRSGLMMLFQVDDVWALVRNGYERGRIVL